MKPGRLSSLWMSSSGVRGTAGSVVLGGRGEAFLDVAPEVMMPFPLRGAILRSLKRGMRVG